MKNKQLWLLTGLFLLTLAWGAGQTRAADAVVGDGSPASCTEAAFDNALAAVQADLGGVITFNCGDAVHMIDIYSTAVIYTQVEINGGDKIHLFAQGSAPLFVKSRFFEVSPGGWLTLRNITLEGARGPAGDGWGSQGGSIVVWGSEDPQERTGLELFSTTILNSASTAWGGAIANEGANVTIENSYIGNSSAKWGGAYHGANGYDTIVNSTITASTAVLGGGGVRFWNSLNSEISGSVINTNSAGGAGGGVENAGGVVTISGSYIEDNTAVQWGGGLNEKQQQRGTRSHAPCGKQPHQRQLDRRQRRRRRQQRPACGQRYGRFRQHRGQFGRRHPELGRPIARHPRVGYGKPGRFWRRSICLWRRRGH